MHIARTTAVGLATVTLLVPCSAVAQNNAGSPSAERRVEVTPHVSFGSAGESGFGAAVSWPLGSVFRLELEMGQRRAERNALTSNVSLLFDLPAVGRVRPYLAAGAGLDQYGYAVASPYGGLFTQAQTAFTVNAGGGIKVSVDDKWGVRSDARWFNGLGRHAPERWRVYNGVTFGQSRR